FLIEIKKIDENCSFIISFTLMLWVSISYILIIISSIILNLTQENNNYSYKEILLTNNALSSLFK
ncbi:hypothetical protein, partial [Enterococcus faecalis]|uniref:hypothetical protein n=1 Tax=Enterococcus faecalis TaxID=1351 RepID=UPI0022E3DEE1